LGDALLHSLFKRSKEGLVRKINENNSKKEKTSMGNNWNRKEEARQPGRRREALELENLNSTLEHEEEGGANFDARP